MDTIITDLSTGYMFFPEIKDWIDNNEYAQKEEKYEKLSDYIKIEHPLQDINFFSLECPHIRFIITENIISETQYHHFTEFMERDYEERKDMVKQKHTDNVNKSIIIKRREDGSVYVYMLPPNHPTSC